MRRRLRQLSRAARLRCPLCGNPWPRQGWLRLGAECPVCQLRLERNENDFFLGSYTVSLFATLMFAVLVTAANVRWPQLPGGLRFVASAAAIVGFPLAFYPVGKMLWLVVDLQFRPPAEKDFGDGSGT